jgi:PIN domain nuclease of toxin-antitoxin system
MQILLDTHAFLWFADGSAKLSQLAKSTIQDGSNERLLGIASLWEMAIKISTGRLSLTSSIDGLVQQAQAQNISLFPISVGYLARVADLPFHHRDPFDRLLAATCLTEGIAIISSDSIFDAYGVNRIW